MSDSEPFLSRWSRRKREEKEEAEAASAKSAAQPTTGDDGARPSGAGQATASPVPNAPGAPLPMSEPASGQELEEIIAKLPKIEELTSQHDLAAFMQRGVPDAIRNAALRKMWTLDPAIRDYVGFYAEYAWDWNTPGGVPGCGPLTESDDVQATLRQLFGDSEDETEGVLEGAAEHKDGPGFGEPSPAVNDSSAAAHNQEAGAKRADAQDEAAAVDAQADAEHLPEKPESNGEFEFLDRAARSSPRRKHGGAVPR